MTMTIALYPGTFDPFHNGHLNIAQRALSLVDHLIVGVYSSPRKQALFSQAERIRLATEAMATLDHGGRVTVCGYDTLTINFARARGATVIVRGLRNSVDFDFEWQMAQTNHFLAEDVEVMCLFANEPFTFLSASLVREVASLGGDVSRLVPECVARAIAGVRF